MAGCTSSRSGSTAYGPASATARKQPRSRSSRLKRCARSRTPWRAWRSSALLANRPADPVAGGMLLLWAGDVGAGGGTNRERHDEHGDEDGDRAGHIDLQEIWERAWRRLQLSERGPRGRA